MHARALASAIFAYAISKGFIVAAVGETKNPWWDARKNIKCQDVEETIAYTERDVECILEALEKVTGREEYSAKLAGMLVATCFYGGLRPSEAAGLRWSNVHLDAISEGSPLVGNVYICEVFVAGKFKKTTKTGECRSIAMLAQLRKLLKFWHATWQHPSDGLVFPNKAGNNPININDISARIVGATLEKAGLNWQGLYSCRRGWGTLASEAGLSVEENCRNMGNSIEVAFKNYVKGKNRTAARGMGRLARGTSETHTRREN